MAMTLLSPFASAQSYYNFREAFLDRKGSIRSMTLLPVEESATTRVFDFRLKTSTDSMTGRIRMPKGKGPFRTGLLAVGIETGKDVIAMIEGHDDVMLMAVDYPFEGEWEFRGWKGLSTTVSLRTMGFRTVPLLLSCLDWLFQQEDVDPSEVIMVAVSFGSFTAIPAAVIDTRVKQLVVVQGGGNLSGVISQNAKRWGTSLPGWLAGWIGNAILSPFEPNKYIPHLSPRPLLMVSGRGDTFFPPHSAEALFENAREPKELVWHKTEHIMPGEKELIKELTNVVVNKLYGEE